MKTWIPMVLLACLLSGCADAPPGEDDLPMPQAAADMGGGLRASRLEDSARPLSEEEILSAYDRAVLIYGWFELEPLPNNGHTTWVDGTVYRQVEADGVEDMEALRTCLRSVFSQELTDQLLSAGGDAPRYRDIDGNLYVTGTGRSPDPSKGSAELEVEQTADTAYSVNVTVDLLDEARETVTGLECWSFPYAFEDDRWVFTDFRLVY